MLHIHNLFKTVQGVQSNYQYTPPQPIRRDPPPYDDHAIIGATAATETYLVSGKDSNEAANLTSVETKASDSELNKNFKLEGLVEHFPGFRYEVSLTDVDGDSSLKVRAERDGDKGWFVIENKDSKTGGASCFKLALGNPLRTDEAFFADDFFDNSEGVQKVSYHISSRDGKEISQWGLWVGDDYYYNDPRRGWQDTRNLPSQEEMLQELQEILEKHPLPGEREG